MIKQIREIHLEFGVTVD